MVPAGRIALADPDQPCEDDRLRPRPGLGEPPLDELLVEAASLAADRGQAVRTPRPAAAMSGVTPSSASASRICSAIPGVSSRMSRRRSPTAP